MNRFRLISSVLAFCLPAFAGVFAQNNAPRDNFYDRYMHTEKQPLAYDHIHEKDVFWEKRVWREIDLRGKRNQHFGNPVQPFAKILVDAVQSGDLPAYSTWSDDFSRRLSKNDINGMCNSTDTVVIIDPATFNECLTVVNNPLDLNDIKKFRVKEVWFFDEETSRMNVRILGIAPIIDRYDDMGNFLTSLPLFWIYYPEARPLLARNEAFNPENDAMRMSWDDVFEARLFESNITKASNIHDARLQDQFAGIDILVASGRIHQEIFAIEHDLWEY